MQTGSYFCNSPLDEYAAQKQLHQQEKQQKKEKNKRKDAERRKQAAKAGGSK